MEEVRRADIHVMQDTLDDLRYAVEGLADSARNQKGEISPRINELILDIADEISGFPDKANRSSMEKFGYDGDRLDAGIYFYINVIDDLPPDRVTYCESTFHTNYDLEGEVDEDLPPLDLSGFEKYYYKPDKEEL